MEKMTIVTTLLVLGLINIGTGHAKSEDNSGVSDSADSSVHSISKREMSDYKALSYGYNNYEDEGPDSITVKTRDLINADVSGLIHMVFYDDDHSRSREVVLPPGKMEQMVGRKFGTYLFSRNSEHTFDYIDSTRDLSNISVIEIWQEPAEMGLEREWKPELITLQHGKDDVAYFPIDRWFEPNVHYFFGKYDTFLPQNDPFPEQRQRDLQSQRHLYQYMYNGNMKNAIKVKELPADDVFTVDTFYKMIGENAIPIVLSKMKKVGKPTWDNYEDFYQVYDDAFLPVPMYAEEDARDDVWFGLQRLQGIDPGLIELAETVPSNFGIDIKEIEKHLEKKTLKKALKKKKIFIVDLKINKPLRDDLKLDIGAPLALFYLNKKGDLMPIAIQLFQEKGKDNPVFYPSDDTNLWHLAKLYYNHAEAAHHQSIAHFSRTHSMMEAVAVCTQRTLALNHPVYRILKPHFIYTFAINKLVGPLLTTPGGLIDSTMSLGHEGLMFFNNLGLKTYDMTRDGFVIQRFIDQKVTEKYLKYYPYRDDISKVFLMIRKYVASVLGIYYKNDKDLKNDVELLEWRRNLAGKPDQLEGLGIKGVPGNDQSGFKTVDQLIDCVTILINIASGIHSTVNFLQYEWYGYPPNYAAYLKGPIPTEKRNYTSYEVLNYLPNRSKLCDILMLSRYLVTKVTNNLGDFEVPMLYHPEAKAAVKTFQDDIRALSYEIRELNKKRKRPYIWADPATFPNAVNI